MHYADATEDPSDIFKFLHKRQAFVDLALFYEAWAWAVEHRGNVKKVSEGVRACACACVCVLAFRVVCARVCVPCVLRDIR